MSEFGTHVSGIDSGKAMIAYPGVVKFSPTGTDVTNQFVSRLPLKPPLEMIVYSVGEAVGTRVGRVGNDVGSAEGCIDGCEVG